MALHHDLPIYKPTYALLVLISEFCKNMPRNFKTSLGVKLQEECVDLTVLIFRANVSFNKTPFIEMMRERIQVVELQLRLSQDLRLISTKQYSEAITLTDDIGRQTTGWLKSSIPAPALEQPRLF
jgi:hypothetical protein